MEISVFDGHGSDYCAKWLAFRFHVTLDKILGDTKEKNISEEELIEAYKVEDNDFVQHCEVNRFSFSSFFFFWRK